VNIDGAAFSAPLRAPRDIPKEFSRKDAKYRKWESLAVLAESVR